MTGRTARRQLDSGETGSTWEMKKEAEYVVPANPGGGSDISARKIAEIAQKRSWQRKILWL